MADWSVIIPVKRLTLAKTRLRGALTGGPHDDLVLALAADTVAAAGRCAEVGAVLVVTDEPAVRRKVSELGAEPVADAPDAGLNPALEYGAGQALRRRPGDGVAALGADLPALRPEDLAAALTAAGRHRRAYAADAERSGTVLLTARPGAPLAPFFGTGSAEAHRLSGAMPLDGDWPSLRRDVDTAEDLAEAAQLGLGPYTLDLLRSWKATGRGVLPRPREDAGQTAGGGRVGAVQATVATFDEEARSGSALLDDGSEVTFDAAAFNASPLRMLRLGQRIALETDDSGHVVRLTIPTIP
ncbi:MAG: 2-phospho-L-lactate guanylyltransferase [Micromonosporaceae bacterium]|nr:2-phospho-L-lactate guanylyltransferase [Micromonosporaceae bacterium]